MLISRLSPRSRVLLPTVGGIAAGVLLVATGWTPLQLVGVLVIGLALVVARTGARLSDAWLRDPRGQISATVRSARQRMPLWIRPVSVAALVGVATFVLFERLLTAPNLGVATLYDLGKGAIAILMMASLAFWNRDGLPRSFRGWIRGSGERRAADTEQIADEALG
jgi:hypothetical protein